MEPTASNDNLPRFARIAFVTLIVVWALMRFVALESSPRGFFMDESRGALNVMCLAQSGRSADGEAWPLFATGFAGGYYTAPYLYSALAWTRLFGESPTSFRALAAFFNILTLLGLYVLARRLCGGRTAAFVLLAGALSPWSWQFSRIAWDPPLAPAFLVWGTCLMVLSRRTFILMGAGVCFALALYSYPPMRITAPLWGGLIGAIALRTRFRSPRDIAIVAVTCAIVSLPLVRTMFDPSFLGRSSALSIFGRAHIDANRAGLPRAIFVAESLLGNLMAHVHPRFLIFRGDANLRHSAQIVGQVGPVDLLAFAIVAWWCARTLWAAGRNQEVLPLARPTVFGFAILAIAGAGMGILPAALTWEGVPHALRAIATWPFVALVTGLVLAEATRRRRWLLAAVCGVAVMYSGLYFGNYFGSYRRINREWFHFDVQERMDRKDLALPEALAPLFEEHSDLQLRYHVMRRGHSCEESKRILDQLRE